MNLIEELKILLVANVPLIQLITYEEERVIQSIAALDAKLGVYTWDPADCKFAVIREANEPFPNKELASDKLLGYIAEKGPRGSAFILKDFHHCWKERRAYTTRKLRNMAPELRAKGQFLVVVTPVNDLPVELKDDAAVVEVPLPEAAELDELFASETRKLDRSVMPRPALLEKLITSALGLTTTQALLAHARAYARKRRFDETSIDAIVAIKRQLIRESGALEFWPATAGEGAVGGLDKLKEWFRIREQAFTKEAREALIPYPRGAALIGVPGTGKSLSAKMLAALWKLPLLRLDVGALFGSLLGQSEENMRKAIQLAETVSPCILWIDEVEKAFAG